MTTPFNATGATTPNPDQQAQIQPFPPPQTFTFLPQLYTLISHLAPLQPQPKDAHTTTSSSRASRSPTLTRRTDAPLTLTQTRSRDEAVDVKDLPALVYPLRQQIEGAKEVVMALPDVGRSVGEQECEIALLEARVMALKGRLGRLGALAAGREPDVVMSGVEGTG